MDDDEYEYVYDTNESNTYLVELDLSTLNGIKRENTSKRYQKRRKKAEATAGEDAAGQSSDGEDDQVAGDNDDGNEDESAAKKNQNTFQMLDIDTLNPVIGYKGEFYSCTWHDTIGTELFFTLPHQQVSHPPLRSTKDYQLLGTSRVKLVGQRAKVSAKKTNNSHTHKKQRLSESRNSHHASLSNKRAERDSGAADQSDGEHNAPRPDPQTQVQEQTDFLQKLMQIQQARRSGPPSGGASHVDR